MAALALAGGSIERTSTLAELRKGAVVGDRTFYSYELWESHQVAEGSATVALRMADELGGQRSEVAATTANPMLATKTGPLIIGCNPENNACFNGWFDEFRVWNVARTEQQIMASYNRPLVGNEAGLVGYYRLEEKMGTVVHDSSPSANHATLDGAVWALSDPPLCGP